MPAAGEEDLILPDCWICITSVGAARRFLLWRCGGKYYATGFVGALDAGTYGVDGWKAADRFWRNAGHMHIKSFLSVLPEGLTIFPPKTPTMPEAIDVDRYVQMIRGNKKGRALGVKRCSWAGSPYKSVTTDTQLLDICRAIADGSDSHMMVHISGQCMDPPGFHECYADRRHHHPSLLRLCPYDPGRARKGLSGSL